ncbi:TPA: hypothetical protein ACH3X1_010669 [Trebouxia sp. C0004]
MTRKVHAPVLFRPCLTVAVVGIPNASALATGDVESATVNGGIGLDPVFQSWSHLWSLGVTGEEDHYYNMTQGSGDVDSVGNPYGFTQTPLAQHTPSYPLLVTTQMSHDRSMDQLILMSDGRYLSSTTSSMTLRLVSYNADAQSLAFVQFPFEWQDAGVIMGGPPYILALPVLAYSSHGYSRWRAIIPDVLVMLVIAVFGVNVVQRIRQVTHKDHRHLWQILYERTGLLLDVAILVLQVSSVLVFMAYALVQANQLGGSTPTYDVYDSDNYPLAHYPLIQRVESAEVANGTATKAGGPNRYLLEANYTGIQGFETFLFNTSVLYNLLVVYAFVQALVLILMLCSFIQRWSFDPKMGPIARVLWQSFPELCHVGAVLAIVALMLAIMGSALFGDRAQSFSTLADSMKVMAILMVVGVMDDARADILGDGNILLSPVESVSQEVYCFFVPFILKWVVAALVVSVLVNLFSSLRKQGDHSHSSVVAQIQALLVEWWQGLFEQAPSNLNILGTFFRLNGRGRRFRALATSVRSFVRRAVSWTSTLSSGKRAPLRRSVRLHGVLHTAMDIQEAVEKLQIWSPSGIVSRPKPKVRSPFGWFSWLFSRPLNKVHPMPDIVWRHTGTSTEDSDEDDKQWSADLVEAAMVLLEETTLAGATKPAELQQQQQSIGALAAKDWHTFVGKCTAVKPRAVASSRLLAMRKAVPSPSARMVFQSQALSAEESAYPVNDVGREGSAKDPDEGLARMQGTEAAVAIPPNSGSSQQAVKAWLASSEPVAHVQADLIAPPSVAAITAEQPGPVAALVQQFEDLGFPSHPSKKHGHGLASLMDNSLFGQTRQRHPQRPTDRTLLTPLEIPGVSVPDEAGYGGIAIIEPDKPLPAVAQGADARNNAAMAAHRARLHQKGHQQDQWAIASKQTAARRLSTQPRQTLNVSVAPSQLSLDDATDKELTLAVERSSISAAWAQIRGNNPPSDLASLASGKSSSLVSPRRPLVGRFGSLSTADSQTLSPMSRHRPAALTIADIMQQASVATPSEVGDAPLWASTDRRPPPALTVAQIMRQNTRLPPLEIAPPLPSGWAQASLTPTSARFLVASAHSLISSGGHSNAESSGLLKRGKSNAAPILQSGGPEYWSDPGASSPSTPRHRVRLPPLSPTRSGMLLSPGSASQTPRAANKLLRWGTQTAAELEAADHANTAAELGGADLADQPRLLRWGTSTTVDLAAADDANARAQRGPVGIASLSIGDSIRDRSIGRPAAQLASRLLRWGASTAADAARLEQGWLEHRQHMQTQMGGANTSAELGQPPPDLHAAHQEHHTQQWQQRQGRSADVVKHWTLLESGELPGASAENLPTAQAQAAQLRQASHLDTEGSNILTLLEDTAEATCETEVSDAKMSLKMSAEMQSQPTQLRHGQGQDAVLLQPMSGAHSQHHRLREGIADLPAPRLTQAADTAVAKPYVKPAGHMIGPAHQKALRHRQRAGMAQGKGRGHKGILSFAQFHTSRVTPEVAAQGAAAPNSQTCSHVLLTCPNHTEHATTLPARASDNIHARQESVSCNQDRIHAARAMYRKPGRPTMRVALQQSIQQVKACTLQLVEQGIQQRAMQEALEGMITLCDNKFGPKLQVQQK